MDALDDESGTPQMLERVKRSLVQVRNGRMGAGAGIIWRHDGLILTNHHVVSRGKHTIRLTDGQEYPAEIVESDPEFDLALLKINADNLPAALISDSRGLRVGQLVFAAGHPWGQVNFITSGIISAMGTYQTRSGRIIPYIRSDAPLAPGNSGGPLVNAAGGVIGINHMIIGGDQYTAIPAHLARQFVEGVLQKTRVEQEAYL